MSPIGYPYEWGAVAVLVGIPLSLLAITPLAIFISWLCDLMDEHAPSCE